MQSYQLTGTIDTTNSDENNDTCVEEYEQKEDGENRDEIVTDTSEYAVDFTHIAFICRFNIQHLNYGIFWQQLKIETNDYSMWQVGNKQSEKNGMKLVIESAENNATCCKIRKSN